MPELRLPERAKVPGVSYAVTSDGLELPVVDITHPAFQLELGPEREQAAVAHFLAEQRRFARLPALLRSLLLRFFMRGSIMARGLRRAEGTFLDGMTTYLFKLGPKNLGAYARPIDRRIAASLPGISLRLRLADMARLLSDSLVEALAAQPERPLYFLNIAGGPAVDSLNALMLLQKERPELIAGRRVVLCVLDGDSNGPAFGAEALRALQQPGAPLVGLNIEFRHLAYDWSRPAGLEPALSAVQEQDAIAIASSEGGLFEYGSDEDILANLRALVAGSGQPLAFVGSVTRDDETIRTIKLTSNAATRPRGLAVFGALVERAGWRVSRSVARPLSDQVVVVPASNRLYEAPQLVESR